MKQFVVGSALLMFISSLSANATNDHAIQVTAAPAAQRVAFEPAYGDTLPPYGYVDFCQRNAADCRPAGLFADRIQLTSAKATELQQVDDYVNTKISPATDMEIYGKVEYWAYPTTRGDCEDYVLLKQRMLIERGFPESALLITVVRDENNEGHAVLTVRTDHGDYILDNKRKEIVRWSATPYTFIKRQSAANPLVWISLVPPDQVPQPTVSASHSN